MKKVGLTGPPGSGKTTLWMAVTGGVGSSDVAAVEVPEPRLDTLVELHASKSRVPARIEVADVHATARTQAAATARLREMDAVLVVVPAFGGQEPAEQLASFIEDLILADMGPVETRISRARKDLSAKKELPALERAMATLSEGRPLSSQQWETPDLAAFSALAPITLKPLMVVYNVDEDSSVAQEGSGFPSFTSNAALEAEVAGMDPAEALPLLESFGITETSLGHVISSIYGALDLITFFTTSDKESRAWEVTRGATAPEAAGVIHSDLQRGFIRAEVVGYDTLVEAGSWDAAKKNGSIRVEGKDYVFAEGDVTHFRFAV